MRSQHARNTVRAYVIFIIFLAFLFFSNDFGIIDVQKTAIVTAAGIDREGDEFILTSQIAVPQPSQQGKQTQAVQLVSRGKTIAEAFDQINGKTGWYPKLVFCRLVVFGKKAAEENVFDALDFFLRDEYLTDDCLLAVCEGTAKELLNASPLVDPLSSTAISKVLSSHAEQTGAVRPANLKDFSIGYFGDSQSGYLPVLKTLPQQEPSPSEGSSNENNSGGQSGESSNGQSGQSGSNSSQSGEERSGGQDKSTQSGGKSEQEKPVFSASETALFVRGRWVETLTREETFAVAAATGKLRLAGYTVPVEKQTCTLIIKQNRPKIELNVGKTGDGELKISVVMVAGVADYSKSQGIEETKDAGTPPDGAFAAAEKKLSATLTTAYEKARGAGCDVFGLQERLIKYKKRQYLQHKDTLLDNTALSIKIRFVSLR